MDFDRRVHATLTDHSEIVRYERSGKYYREFPASAGITRKLLKLDDAVELALTGKAHLGVAGGLTFDARYRAAAAKQKPAGS